MKTKLAIFLFAVILSSDTKVLADQDPNFYIFLCFGQSNMESGTRLEAIDQTPVDKRFQVLADFDNASRGWKKGTWYKADPPITARGRGFNLVDYFGRTMVANLPEKYRIGIVKCSVSGTKIELWDKDAWKTYLDNLPSGDAWKITAAAIYQPSPYQFLVDQAKIAQKDGVIRGILIHQGESNFEDPNWPLKVKKIYGDLMKDLDLKPENVTLLAGEVVNADHQGQKAAFNEILKKLPETLPNSYAISSAGLPCNNDHLHFNAAGFREFGRRYAEKMLSVMGYKATEPKEPYVQPETSSVTAPSTNNAEQPLRPMRR
ncbi:MAG: hypothetical protein JW787_06170 [Sedimentisphaerales bacterium]|nr:hypothetical protein [Sedimentisphaerales bacterium]